MVAQEYRPEDVEQLRDLVLWATAEHQPLEIIGSGSKRAFGRPEEVDVRLATSAFSGIVAYEPEELVLTARAGTPLAELEHALGERRQMLAFEPRDLSDLFAGDDAPANAGGTLGGVVACNLAGPRRLTAGAARDHVLGFHAVSGRGEVFKSGGRVVKNVTGFDLSKLIAGSFGTLAVMTELTVRALPAPETTRTLLLFGSGDADAVRAMTLALQTPYEVSGAAHLPATVAARSGLSGVREAGAGVTALRLEGPGPSVDFRAAALRALLDPLGEVGEIGQESTRLWREIRDVRLIAAADRPIWRLSVPPAEGARIAGRILDGCDGEALYDWGGGLIWLALAVGADHDRRVREAIGASGGHATLVRAPDTVRAAAEVFQPQSAALAALTRRVKEAFDPHGILNPGRMYPGV
jgi:glycolate oxidase FAD binding subunit